MNQENLLDMVAISSPNVQAPAASLPCVKLVDVNRNLSLGNVEFIARNARDGYPENINGDSQVSQMVTDQANTITQNQSNASPEQLGIPSKIHIPRYLSIKRRQSHGIR